MIGVRADTAFYDRILSQAALSFGGSRKRAIVGLSTCWTQHRSSGRIICAVSTQPTAHFQTVVQSAARVHGTTGRSTGLIRWIRCFGAKRTISERKIARRSGRIGRRSSSLKLMGHESIRGEQ